MKKITKKKKPSILKTTEFSKEVPKNKLFTKFFWKEKQKQSCPHVQRKAPSKISRSASKKKKQLERVRSSTSLGSLKTNFSKTHKKAVKKVKIEKKRNKYSLLKDYKVIGLGGRQKQLVDFLSRFKNLQKYQHNEQYQDKYKNYERVLKGLNLIVLILDRYKIRQLIQKLQNQNQQKQKIHLKIKQATNKLQTFLLKYHLLKLFDYSSQENYQYNQDQNSLICNQQINVGIYNKNKLANTKTILISNQFSNNHLLHQFKTIQDPVFFTKIVQNIRGSLSSHQYLSNIIEYIFSTPFSVNLYQQSIQAIKTRISLASNKSNLFNQIKKELDFNHYFQKIEDDVQLIKQDLINQQALIHMFNQSQYKSKQIMKTENILRLINDFFQLDCSKWLLLYLNTRYGSSPAQRLAKMQGYNVQDKNNQFQFNQVFQTFKKRQIKIRRHQSDYVYQRAVFDSFIKQCNFYKPFYDMNGIPYPWCISQKGTTFFCINQQSLQQLLQQVSKKLIQFSLIECGKILQKDLPSIILYKGFPLQLSKYKGVRQILYKKESQLIKHYIEEEDRLWKMQEDQKTETTLIISNLIQNLMFQQLVKECIQ